MEEERDWEGHYARGETPWDKGEAAPGLVRFLEENAVRGRVLVPGCGLGHDVRALASGGAQVVGLDISPTAVARAGEIERAADETYRHGDLFALDDDLAGVFDWVWEHTCFCAIEPEQRPDYVRAVRAALKPGGTLLAVFYIDPYDDEHRPGQGPPHGCSLEELEVLFSGDFEIRESWVPREAYPGREGLERMMVLVRR